MIINYTNASRRDAHLPLKQRMFQLKAFVFYLLKYFSAELQESNAHYYISKL